MKREILFRGKRTDNGEWVEGYFRVIHHVNGIAYIISNWFGKDFYVIPETVNLFTGITDKNGIKIFEGDIVKSDYGYGLEACEVDFESFIYAKIECCVSDNIEVIGNIYDAPNLINK